MEVLADLLAWFTDPANWSGRDALPERLLEHITLSAGALAIGLLIALPVALYIGHTGRGAFIAISLTNIGRALPSYALLVILFGLFVQVSTDLTVITNGPTLLAMVALAIPPIVTNTYAGLRDVDPELVEAARGMGMRGTQVLRNVEIPLALPVIIAGLRIATVQVIATAALGAVIGGGGLGRYIIQGIARFDQPRLLAGALLVILLAIAADAALGWWQRRATSPGTAPSGVTAESPTAPVRGGSLI
jgi:osmoprotectant transport system permease protein